MHVVGLHPENVNESFLIYKIPELKKELSEIFLMRAEDLYKND